MVIGIKASRLTNNTTGRRLRNVWWDMQVAVLLRKFRNLRKLLCIELAISSKSFGIGRAVLTSPNLSPGSSLGRLTGAMMIAAVVMPPTKTTRVATDLVKERQSETILEALLIERAKLPPLLASAVSVDEADILGPCT